VITRTKLMLSIVKFDPDIGKTFKYAVKLTVFHSVHSMRIFNVPEARHRAVDATNRHVL
jgi:hypothetical protein